VCVAMNVGLFAAIKAYTGRWLNRTTLKDVLLTQWGTSDYLSGSYRLACVSDNGKMFLAAAMWLYATITVAICYY